MSVSLVPKGQAGEGLLFGKDVCLLFDKKGVLGNEIQ